ncbi:MAG: UDP-N-acetylenolpyruvoylglucosamine reductase [Phototrophicales bacterium]|nr:MAG: UDP-N-acetylenolpyruvoylglucosamine reductase [Phototrophicales bacterium]RMG72429.1 MAG: UDP-N-acetylmuramate dehydrogenase [Chloroflexota bacterium]
MEVLQHKLGERLLRDEPMTRYTAARLGGKADWLYIARDSVEELAEVVNTAWQHHVPVTILGGGANVLVSDCGIRGLVVINRVSQVEFGHWHGGRTVSATSGTGLTVLANKCQSYGITGMEWAVNVPGTVGGAVVNNAGAHGGDMAQSVADVVVLQPDGPKLYTHADLAYDYRYSALKGRQDRRFLVLLATFNLKKDDPSVIKARMNEFIAQRKRSQPSGASLGSIFKNPPGDYAGRLIDAAGLKGYQIGQVMVSPVHANFFINTNPSQATAAEYYALIQHVQQVVYAQSGVKLELEVQLIGDW